MRKRKWKVLVALTLCLALVGGTFYFAGGKDALKTKADSYGEEKGAPKDRQGILSLITNLIGGGSNSSNSISDTDGSGSDSASEQLNKNGLGSLSGLLGNGAISKILDLVSGGKIGMIKNLINTAMGLFNSNKSVSANQNCVVSDVRKLSNKNGTEEYAVAYADKDSNTPYGYAVLKYDNNANKFVVRESNIRKGQRNAYASN